MDRGAFNNLLVAHAQIWGMFIALFAIIVMIFILLLVPTKLDPTTEKLTYTVLGVFLAKFGDMIAYLYNRQRPNDGPAVVPSPNDPIPPKENSP